MTSARPGAPPRPGLLRVYRGQSRLVEVLLGPEATDPVQVERGQGESKHDGHLGHAHDPQEPSPQVGDDSPQPAIWGGTGCRQGVARFTTLPVSEASDYAFSHSNEDGSRRLRPVA